jgi:magnesium-transporting ATPase (P-type)
MKARLPRGVDNIRGHIENVDDVPLHVSLFAECSPKSTKEMIKIFQEYGEVVCCIGSSLNDFNVECFALVGFLLV